MKDDLSIASHAAEVTERGCTIIPCQVGPDQLAALNRAADRALDKVSRALAAGVRPAHTLLNPYVRAVRCFYTWDSSSLQLLNHPTVHELGRRVLGSAKLWEMSVLEALPKPAQGDLGPFDWHRDFSALPADGLQQAYLWVFICLTDVTADNGATCVVPGSHRNPALNVAGTDGSGKNAGWVQLTAKAGDIVAMNPVMLHRVGENRTQTPRRLALVGLCRSDRQPLLNHWAIAGDALRREMPPPVSQLLHTDDWRLDEAWDVLPDGWATSGAPPLKRGLRRLARAGSSAMDDVGRVWRRLGRVVS